ncbi:MAG: iron ABC transporter permease [Actinobacteria bacterium]|nr:iron ABC transporter permease [Actinomycetota bacterium]
MKRFYLLVFALVLLSLYALSLGAADVANVWHYITHPLFDINSPSHQIIWEIRAPRIAAAILVGSCLGIAGVLAQGSTNNPLADPAILGTSAGASVGVLAGVLLNVVTIGSVGAVICASIGALLATLFTFSLARSALQLITIGIGVSAILTAVVGLVLSMATRADARSVSFWSFGSLALVTPRTLLILLPILLVCGFLAWQVAPAVDLLSLGDESVRHIGHDAQKIRLRAFAILATLVAVTVSSVGSIAFLALAAPHIARYLVGPRNRTLIFYSAAIGALILLFADSASRALFPPNELPIGLLTSLLGAPILILTLKKGGDVWR